MFISCGVVPYFVCRSGPLDTLIIFTTTVSVSIIYNTSSVVIVPIIWLYITVVVVIISFSVIVSCIFVSLLLVTVGIIYNRVGSSFNVASSILLYGENISFDAILVMYINSTNIPPIMGINRMYETQNFLYIFPMMRHTIVVCINSISPMAVGYFICVNVNLIIVLINISNFVMSEVNLCKMLVFGINEMVFAFPLKF